MKGVVCEHGHPLGETYCPKCEALVDAAVERIKANGGISPRRERQRAERSARRPAPK